jgi:acetolactate decarboxylase
MTPAAVNGEAPHGWRMVGNLLRYGDIGCGKLAEGMGDLVVIGGEAFQIGPDGGIAPTSPSNFVAYGSATFFSSDQQFDVAEVTRTIFEKSMDWKRQDTNKAFAIRVSGLYHIVVARTQDKSFGIGFTEVAGTLVGFWIPASVHGAAETGYQFMFIDDARQQGGWVTDFEIAQARIEIDSSDAFQVLLGEASTNDVSLSARAR